MIHHGERELDANSKYLNIKGIDKKDIQK